MDQSHQRHQYNPCRRPCYGAIVSSTERANTSKLNGSSRQRQPDLSGPFAAGNLERLEAELERWRVREGKLIARVTELEGALLVKTSAETALRAEVTCLRDKLEKMSERERASEIGTEELRCSLEETKHANSQLRDDVGHARSNLRNPGFLVGKLGEFGSSSELIEHWRAIEGVMKRSLSLVLADDGAGCKTIDLTRGYSDETYRCVGRYCNQNNVKIKVTAQTMTHVNNMMRLFRVACFDEVAQVRVAMPAGATSEEVTSLLYAVSDVKKVHAVNVHKIRSFSKYEDALVNLVSSWANWSREGDAELWVRIKDESMESENKRIHSVFTALHSKDVTIRINFPGDSVWRIIHRNGGTTADNDLEWQ